MKGLSKDLLSSIYSFLGDCKDLIEVGVAAKAISWTKWSNTEIKKMFANVISSQFANSPNTNLKKSLMSK
jgi:hypothetical protein